MDKDIDAVNQFIRNHPDCTIGDHVWRKALEFLKQRDELKTQVRESDMREWQKTVTAENPASELQIACLVGHRDHFEARCDYLEGANGELSKELLMVSDELKKQVEASAMRELQKYVDAPTARKFLPREPEPDHTEPDHTEGGRYQMLKSGVSVVEEGDEVLTRAVIGWGKYSPRAFGETVRNDMEARRPVDYAKRAKDILQNKLGPGSPFSDTALDEFVDLIIKAAKQ